MIPASADFGPVDLAVVHSFWQMMRDYMVNPGINGRMIVYYCVSAHTSL